VGKCLPWVLLANSCDPLSGNGGATSLTDSGGERLEGIMNTPGRARGVSESLKHPSSSLWSSLGLAARAAAATESSPLPQSEFAGRHKRCHPPPLLLQSLCLQHSCSRDNGNFFYPAFNNYCGKNKQTAIFQAALAGRGADAE